MGKHGESFADNPNPSKSLIVVDDEHHAKEESISTQFGGNPSKPSSSKRGEVGGQMGPAELLIIEVVSFSFSSALITTFSLHSFRKILVLVSKVIEKWSSEFHQSVAHLYHGEPCLQQSTIQSFWETSTPLLLQIP